VQSPAPSSSFFGSVPQVYFLRWHIPCGYEISASALSPIGDNTKVNIIKEFKSLTRKTWNTAILILKSIQITKGFEGRDRARR
jgi:hypothetical protein